MAEDTLRVGVVTTTHGIAGDVKVFPTTDEPNRFRKLKNVLLETGKGFTELEITRVRFFKNMVILHFKGHDTVESVMPYKGKGLFVARDNAVELGENEYFIADLIGMTVYQESGELLGTLKDVLQTGANDVYVVERPKGREVLIPAIRQCILRVDTRAGEMRVHLLEGLLE